MKISRLLSILIFSFILYIVAIYPQVSIAAEGSSNECVGLDLILLVDHSTSMNGFEGNPATDPQGIRVESVRYVIDQLFVNRLTFCPDAVHRVAVIGFGGRIEPQLPLGIVDVDPSSPLNVWEFERDQLTERIEVIDLGQTNFQLAFEAAAKSLTGLPAINDGVPRKRGIVVLTDGNPCVGGCPYDDSFSAEEYMQEILIPEINDPSGPFSPWSPPYNQDEDIYIWLVAIHDAYAYLDQLPENADENTRTMREYWQEITDAHGGNVFALAQDERKIPETYLLILNQVLGRGKVEQVPCGEPVYVDPYVHKAIFNFLKNSEDVEVKINYNEEQITIANGQVTNDRPDLIDSYVSFGPIERYTINRPGPGRWDIETDCDTTFIYKQILFAQADLKEPNTVLPQAGTDAMPYDINNPVFLQYQLRQDKDNPFVDDGKFPLNAEFSIIQPNGEPYVVAQSNGEATDKFELKPEGNGIYSSAVERTGSPSLPLPQNLVGRYQIHLSISAKSADPNKTEPVLIYQNNDGFYDVRAVNRFDFEIESPKNNDKFNLVEYQGVKAVPSPLEVKVKLQNDEGGALSPEGILFNPDDAFTARLMDQEGEIIQEAPLKLAAAEDGIFVGTLNDSITIPQEISAGGYQLEIALEGEFNADDFLPIHTHREILLEGLKPIPVDFHIKTPSEFDLVDYRGKNPIPTPLEISAQLTDIDGNPVSFEVFKDANVNSFVAQLITPQGRIEKSPLEPDPTGDGLFKAILRSTSAAGLNDQAGDYKVIVSADEKNVANGFVLVADEKEVVSRGIKTTPIEFQIASPVSGENLPFHKSGIGCVAGDTEPVHVLVKFLSGTTLLDGNDIVLDPSVVFSTTITNKSTGELEAVRLEPKQTPKGLQFEGVTDAAFRNGGEHEIEVFLASDDVLKPEYVALADRQTVTFSRSDTLTTSPLVCRSVTGISGIILIGVVVFLGYIFSGGPTGTLVFLDRKNKQLDTIKLHRWRRTNKATVRLGAGLEHEKIGVKARKGLSSTKEDPSVAIEVQDMQKQTFLVLDDFRAKEKISQNIVVKYEPPLTNDN